MKRIKKLALVLSAAALLAAVAAPMPASAQEASGSDEAKAMAVVCLSGYDELINDISFIGKLVERPGLPQMVEGGVAMVTQGKGLVGLDKTKPLGVIIRAGDGEPSPLGFVPVSSLDQLLGLAAPLLGGPVEPDDDGLYKIEAGPEPVFIKEKGGWAFIARSADDLTDLPADPVKLLEGLNKDYDLAVRLNVQNIPEDLRGLAINQLQMGLAAGLERMPDEDEEDYQTRKKIAENGMKNLIRVINETDKVTVGWRIDAKAETTYLDISMTAVEGSALARQAAQYDDTTSGYAGFLLPGAAVTLNASSTTDSKEDIAQAVEMIETLRARAMKAIDEDSDLPDEASRKILKSALGDMIDVLRDTVQAGKFDFGAAVKLDVEALTFAAGMHVSSGAKLEGALKKVAQLAENEPGFEGVEWDADKHAGIRFHTMNVPVPDEEAQGLLGEQLDVVVGVGEKAFYVAFGKDSLTTLKSIIDASQAAASAKVPPMQLAISLAKIMKFAAAQEDDPTTAMLAESLAQAGDKDHIRVTVTGVPNGFLYRLEAEEGVLRAIGKASAAAGGAPGDAPGAKPGGDF